MGRTVAVIGASARRNKFGNKSVRAHVQAGWTVYPVNPTATTIEGLPAFARIEDVPQPVDRISVYVPPQVGLSLLDAFAHHRPGEVFFNPGSDDDAVLDAARQRGLNVVVGCSIVDVGYTPQQFPDTPEPE